MGENEFVEQEKRKLEREDVERIESVEAERRLRQAYTSPVDIARQQNKFGRQGSQTNNGLDEYDEEY